MEQDLSGEKLSSQTDLKKKSLIELLKLEISRPNLEVLPDSFVSLPEDAPSVYIDLDEIQPTKPEKHVHFLPEKISESDIDSGSGYESYASSDDTPTTSKQKNEEAKIQEYFNGTNSEVCGLVFAENRKKIGGVKWIKRIGLIRSGQLQFFKRLGDTRPVIDISLKNFTARMSRKKEDAEMIVDLQGPEKDIAHRFYVNKNKVDEWCRVIQNRCGSSFTAGNLPISPTTSKPTESPPPPPQRSIQRQGSVGGVSDIGKGLKSAVSDIFKKDKIKKRISVAEQMGASLCGNLGVCTDGKWAKKFCLIKNNQLLVHGKEETPEQTIGLTGCDLQPYFDDPERKFTFKLTRNNKEVLFIEAASSSEMGKWVGMLIAETGCAGIPETESIYVEPEAYKNFISNARATFQSTTNNKKSRPSSGSKSPPSSGSKSPPSSGSKSPPFSDSKSPAKRTTPDKPKDQKDSSSDPRTLSGNVKARTQLFETLEKNK